MTRITIASYDDDPPLGGQGVVVHGMRNALQRRGVHVDTISGRGEHAIAFARRTGRAPLDFSLQLNRYPQIVTRSAPDVVHAQGGPGGVLLWKSVGVPVVYTAHHTYRQAHARRSVKRMLTGLEARCYRRAAMVLPVSRSTANSLLEMGIPASRIEVISNGVDAVDLPGVQHEDGRVLFVSRLEKEKGVLEALSTLQSLVRARPGTQGVVVGGGSLEAEVRQAAAASGGRIAYLGALEREQLDREYARAAIVLMPSRFEGLGMVALEAQAAGTPVVGFDVDGLRDAVGVGGVLVAPGAMTALRDAAITLLNDPARRAEAGARGREAVLAEHSWDAIGARLAEIYTAVRGSGEGAGTLTE
jgi:glycosyltransferase involved in cell wall biosynthesis